MRGRIDANRDGNDPGDNQSQNREKNSQGKTLGQKIIDRPLPLKGPAQIAIQQNIPHPFEVAAIDWLVKAILLGESFRFVLGNFNS